MHQLDTTNGIALPRHVRGLQRDYRTAVGFHRGKRGGAGAAHFSLVWISGMEKFAASRPS